MNRVRLGVAQKKIDTFWEQYFFFALKGNWSLETTDET
jgi:hypothetical protein